MVNTVKNTGEHAPSESNNPNRRDFLRTMGQAFVAAPLFSALTNVMPADAKEPAEKKEDPEHEAKMTEAAKEYFRENLKTNREKAKIFQEMLPTIKQFEKFANVKVVVCKCMDGRTQTNDHKWIPPTSAINRRSHGGIINTDLDNRDLWNVLHNAANEAKDATLIVIHAGHRSNQKNSGCAAFKEEKDVDQNGDADYAEIDRRARQKMSEQASSMRYRMVKDSSMEERLQAKKAVVLSGMNNTDTGAMDFFLKGEPIFSAEGTMKERKIRDALDVFDRDFLFEPIPKDKDVAHECIWGKTPKEILGGDDAPFFKDMRVKIAFEAYVMGRVAEGKGKKPGKGIIHHEVLESIEESMKESSGSMNDDVKAFLTYVAAGNLAYAVHYRNLNEKEKDTPNFKARVFHAERKMSYSETGHDLEDKNSLLLIKPSAIDDTTAVTIGRNVLLHNLEDLGLKDKLPPLVHINIELKDPMDTWERYRDVKSRMQTKLSIVENVFGKNVRVLTTYSYDRTVPVSEGGVPRTKQFFPFSANPNNAKIIITPEEDIGRGIEEDTFDPKEIHKREAAYTLQDEKKDREPPKKKAA